MLGNAYDGASSTSKFVRKRALAKRSCLKCREKKTRCELPDVYVDSSRAPLPSDKWCHRCKALGIECIVWDGDRKRKPNLGPRNDSTTRASASSAEATPNLGYMTSTSPLELNENMLTRSQETSSPRRQRSYSNSSCESPQIADAEQLAPSDLSHAQHLLISRQKSWKAMSRTLHTLMERLNREHSYSSYLKLRIDAPPSTPDPTSFLTPQKALELDLQLQDYLVGHPYLPSLSVLQHQQSQIPTRPRALLIATTILLGLKNTEDELASADVRTWSNYVDRLGTQLLFSSPRDVHLVMAFELLLAHEPGLVGTAASQFEFEGRGFGLASENLLTCAIKVAKELKLDESLLLDQHTSSRLAHLSFWCCLKTWEAVYAFLGEDVTILQDLNDDFAAGARQALFCVSDDGRSLPSPPRLQDANGSTARSFREMREFCAEAETQLGKDGILRSAGRTMLCMRVQAACLLFSSLKRLQQALSDSQLSLEQRRERILEVSKKVYSEIMAVRDDSFEHLGFYAGRRLVRLWEQLVHTECAFFSAIYGSYATSALFLGKLDGPIEAQELVQCIRFGHSPAQYVVEAGRCSLDASRTLLATVAQMDRQPLLRAKGRSPNCSSSRFLCRLPTLLVCAMTVHAARRCLESIAFVLLAWAQNSTDAISDVTLMEAAAHQIRQQSPTSSNEDAYTIAKVSADYIDEMIETARLWQVYYRVYRPLSSVKLDKTSGSAAAGNEVEHGQGHHSHQETTSASAQPCSPNRVTAMDFLASAAEAAQTSTSDLSLPYGGGAATKEAIISDRRAGAPQSTASFVFPSEACADLAWNAQGPHFQESASVASTAPTSVGLVDADFYNACLPFDLEAFLKDVDQLF